MNFFKPFIRASLFTFVSLFFVYCGGDNQINTTPSDSGLKKLTLSINKRDIIGIIDQQNRIVTFSLPAKDPSTSGIVSSYEIGPSDSIDIKLNNTLPLDGKVRIYPSANASSPIEYTLRVLRPTSGLFQFRFKKANNPSLTADIVGTINGTVIEFDTIFSNINITALKAYFEVSNGASAFIGQTRQKSDTTANDFSKEQRMSILSEDGNSTNIYTIRPIPQKDAQLYWIPDEDFRKFLIGKLKISRDQNFFKGDSLIINSKDVQEVPDFDITQTSSIRSFAGIEYFKGLRRINYFSSNANGNNLIHSLDFSRNTKLEKISFRNARIDTVILGNNTNLKEIIFINCGVSSLDVSGLPELLYLDCSNASSNLRFLDVSNNRKLTKLFCQGNALDALDLSKNSSLTEVNCSDNNIGLLTLLNNPYLTNLKCYNNNITGTLNLSLVTSLDALECYNNKIQTINIRSVKTAFRGINVYNTNDISKDTELREVQVAAGLSDQIFLNGLRTLKRERSNIKIKTYSSSNVEVDPDWNP